MLPIYRLSEGKENLGKNNDTFDACQKILVQNKMVILFAEGLSENNWDLRPMRKGLARLAHKAWKSNNDSNQLQVVPIGLTYEHFEGEGKIMLINIGKPIVAEKFDLEGNEAQFVREFNLSVSEGLAGLIPVFPELKPKSKQHQVFRAQLRNLVQTETNVSKILSSINLSSEGGNQSFRETKLIKTTLVFWPLYAFSEWTARKLFKQALFHDSVIFGLLLLLILFSSCSLKQAFFYGWFTGFVFFGLGVSWVYISIHDFGEVPSLEAGALTAALAAACCADSTAFWADALIRATSAGDPMGMVQVCI
jgi:hypothetical protein